MTDESKREGRRGVFALCLDLISKGKLSQLEDLAGIVSTMSTEGPEGLDRRELFRRAAAAVAAASIEVPSESSSEGVDAATGTPGPIDVLENRVRAENMFIINLLSSAWRNACQATHPPAVDVLRDRAHTSGGLDPDHIPNYEPDNLSPKAVQRINGQQQAVRASLSVFREVMKGNKHREKGGALSAGILDDPKLADAYVQYALVVERENLTAMGYVDETTLSEEDRADREMFEETARRTAEEDIALARRLYSADGSADLQAEITRAEQGLQLWQGVLERWLKLNPEYREAMQPSKPTQPSKDYDFEAVLRATTMDSHHRPGHTCTIEGGRIHGAPVMDVMML